MEVTCNELTIVSCIGRYSAVVKLEGIIAHVRALVWGVGGTTVTEEYTSHLIGTAIIHSGNSERCGSCLLGSLIFQENFR